MLFIHIKIKVVLNKANDEEGEEEKFNEEYPVLCGVCQTEVGVYDKDGVYHFYNVFPSNA